MMVFQSRVLSASQHSPQDTAHAGYVNALLGRAALAETPIDGAFSERWGRLLARNIVCNPPANLESNQWHEWLGDRQRDWAKEDGVRDVNAASTLMWVAVSPFHDDDDINWESTNEKSSGEIEVSTIEWDQELIEKGIDREVFTVRAAAYGEYSLLHVRNGQLLPTFHTDAPRGATLSSCEETPPPTGALKHWQHTCLEEDGIIMCTREVAKWARAQAETDARWDWSKFWEMDAAAWRAEVRSLQASGQLKSSDAALVLLRLGAAPETPKSQSPMDSTLIMSYGEIFPNEVPAAKAGKPEEAEFPVGTLSDEWDLGEEMDNYGDGVDPDQTTRE